MANATKQHTYGSGEISFARFLPNTQTPGAFRYLGNTPEFTLSAEQETLDHMDTDHGIRYRDDSVVTSQTMGGNIVTDNINQENVALFFTGTTGIITQASATAQTQTTDVTQQGTYILGVTNANPTGVRHVTVTTVTDGAGTPVPYVAGTDYVVDSISGTVTFPEGSAAIGNKSVITFNVAASTRTQVISGNDAIEGALRFKSFNPKGPRTDYLLPYVRLSPDGDFALKGDDWLTIPFALDVLRKGDLAAVYADGVAVTS